MSEDIKALHDLTEEVLLKWMHDMPAERREAKAFELLVDALQNLYAACINLGVADQIGDE